MQKIFSCFKILFQTALTLSYVRLVRSMNSGVAEESLYPSSERALAFLFWCGLVVAPSLCVNGHRWTNVAHRMLYCRFMTGYWLDLNDLDRHGQAKRKRSWCGRKHNWRKPDGGFISTLPVTILPDQFLKLLFWFSENAPFKRIVQEAEMGETAVRETLLSIRKVMWWKVESEQANSKLGGRRCIVVIDETYFTRRRRIRGSRFGRRTHGHCTCILAMVEIDMIHRRETGKVVMVRIAGPTKALIKEKVDQYVEPGSLIFTDSHASYKWLGDYGYVHRSVNHKEGEFARSELVYGVWVRVTSNPAEGLFGRCKAFARAKGVKKIARGHYGYILAEFVWRAKHLHSRSEWRDAPLFPVLDLLVQYQDEILSPRMDMPLARYIIDDDLKSIFDDVKQASRALIPNPPEPVAAEVPLPAAEPPADLPLVQQDAAEPREAHVPVPAVARAGRRRRHAELLPVAPTPKAAAAAAHAPAPAPAHKAAPATPPMPDAASPSPRRRRQASSPASQASIDWKSCITGAHWLHSEASFGILHAQLDGVIVFPTFEVAIAYDDNGIPMIAQWKLDVQASSAHKLVWGLNEQQCTWTRVQSPPRTSKPWSKGTTIAFLYSSDSSDHIPTERVATVTGYTRVRGGPGVRAELPNREVRSYAIREMYHVRTQS